MDGTSPESALELVSMVFLEDEVSVLGMLRSLVIIRLELLILNWLVSYKIPLQAGKRAHHNALERKRRDHIKDSFYCLRDAVPQLRGEKVYTF